MSTVKTGSVPGIVLCIHLLILALEQCYELGFIFCILQPWKLKFREGTWLTYYNISGRAEAKPRSVWPHTYPGEFFLLRPGRSVKNLAHPDSNWTIATSVYPSFILPLPLSLKKTLLNCVDIFAHIVVCFFSLLPISLISTFIIFNYKYILLHHHHF